MRTLFATLALLATTAVFADTFVPYTDGRQGGCYLTSTNVMYGCDPQPQQAAPVPEVVYVPMPSEPRVVYRDRPAPPATASPAYSPPPAPLDRAAESKRSASIDSLLSPAGKECAKAGGSWVCRGTACSCK